jgi:nucleoside-diphosphate-sugar epimerase
MKKVLLTGASGFIGRHCLPLLLARGYEVHAVSSKHPQTEALSRTDVHWHQADLLDAAQSSDLLARVRPTHLLHLAWYAVPGKFWTSPENFRWVQASLSLFQEFAAGGGTRMVGAGTCAEYDWRYGYCSEGLTPPGTATLYGTCKHSLQLMLDVFARQSNLSSAWGRVFFPYGPHEHPEKLVAYVIRSLLRAEPARCSHGEQLRDLLYVGDVAGAFVALLESEVTGAVNIGSGRPVALKEVIHRIGQRLQRPDLIRLGAIPPSIGDTPLLVADVARLRDEVRWQPEYDLDEGLEQTISWWEENISVHEPKE